MPSTNCSECGAGISPVAHENVCQRCLFALALCAGLKNGSIARILPSPAAAMERPGKRIGRYKLLQKIGEGGFGTVHLAEQEEPIRRRVALKVIKLGMDTKNVVARFEAERQALALMDHPNIAKVIDAGATKAGRPFFAMEMVHGIKITDYCDENNLPTEERLKLFMQVCQAVQHAHQKGIIHRDLKPSNILVMLQDGAPVPKVIDFGIAKAIEGRLTDKTLCTEFQHFIGTPAYMSPEQAQPGALDIDTRSDIYSLGVLLYELLTSNTPFDSKTLLRAGLDEIRRVIREEEPPKPSTRLSTLAAEELAVVARKRDCTPPALNERVRGELDWIVMKALEKDRTRRYDSASAFARDVERHLRQEPVSAAAPRRLYKFQKFARRNRVALATTTSIAALLVAGTIISILLAVRAFRAEEIAVTEARKGKQVSQFLKDLLKSVGPSVALGRDTKMLREILDRTAARIGKDLEGQPGVEAELRTTVGQVYVDLGDFEKAEAAFCEALVLREKLLGREHTDVADSLKNLAYVLQAQGKVDEAENMFIETLLIRKKLLGDEDPSVATALSHLGSVLHRKRKLPEAADLQRQALTIRRRLGNENRYVAESLYLLANVRWSQGEQDEAVALHREALAIRRKLPNEDLAVAASLMDLGRVLSRQNDLAAAEDNYTEALTIRRKLLDSDHPDVTRSLTVLATMLDKGGKLPEAERLFNELAYHHLAKGLAEYRQGRFASAADWANKALAKAGKDEHLAALSYMVMAMAHHQLSDTNKAQVALAKALESAATQPPKLERSDFTDSGHRWLIFQILLREAETLLSSPSPVSVPAN